MSNSFAATPYMHLCNGRGIGYLRKQICEKGDDDVLRERGESYIEESVGVDLLFLNFVEKSKKGRKVHQLT
jgi:hypothetical protein